MSRIVERIVSTVNRDIVLRTWEDSEGRKLRKHDMATDKYSWEDGSEFTITFDVKSSLGLLSRVEISYVDYCNRLNSWMISEKINKQGIHRIINELRNTPESKKKAWCVVQ